MCESTVFVLRDGEESKLMDNVGWIEIDGDSILIKDAEGNKQTLSARVVYADLVGHHITLEPV